MLASLLQGPVAALTTAALIAPRPCAHNRLELDELRADRIVVRDLRVEDGRGLGRAHLGYDGTTGTWGLFLPGRRGLTCLGLMVRGEDLPAIDLRQPGGFDERSVLGLRAELALQGARYEPELVMYDSAERPLARVAVDEQGISAGASDGGIPLGPAPPGGTAMFSDPKGREVVRVR